MLGFGLWQAVTKMSIDAVKVWLINTLVPQPELAVLSAFLDGAEIKRRNGLRDASDQRSYAVTHAAARLIAAAELGVAPQDVQWTYSANGKPSLEGAQISLSHSGELSLVAIAQSRSVGVDLQEVLPSLDTLGMAARFFLPGEAESIATSADHAATFASLWARKEAVIKAHGGRLMQGLRIPVQGRREMVTSYPGAAAHRVTDVEAPQGFRAAVALAGAEPFEVVSQLWDQRTAISAVDR